MRIFALKTEEYRLNKRESTIESRFNVIWFSAFLNNNGLGVLCFIDELGDDELKEWMGIVVLIETKLNMKYINLNLK
jgi:hypothetical protein